MKVTLILLAAVIAANTSVLAFQVPEDGVRLIEQRHHKNTKLQQQSAKLLRPRASTKQAIGALKWDNNNFFLGGTPFFPYGAEFHPWRLPVPGLWRDVLQKLKSQGFNMVSIYTHWALVMPSPNPSSASLTSSANDLTQFLAIAREVDMLVALRPGPYINAETTGGGFPGWVQNLETQVRTNTTVWNEAWKPYMKAILRAARQFQLTLDSRGEIDRSGGTLVAIQVENEFFDTPQTRPYFDEIISFYREDGIDLPTYHNAAHNIDAFVTDTNLDLVGRDTYPNSFDCSKPERWNHLPDYTESPDHQRPMMIPESQGGGMAGWGSTGYEDCAKLTNSSFIRVFEKALLADGVKFKSNYMGFGGTNWGGLAFSNNVDSSYDYGAGLAENRMKREKGGETSLLGSFLSSFPSFAETRVVERGSNVLITQGSVFIFVSHLSSGSSSWYIVRQNDSTSSQLAEFKLNIKHSANQSVTIPQRGKVTLVGRDSVIIPVNISLSGSGALLLYSTADVSFLDVHDSSDVLFLHGQEGQNYELSLQASRGENFISVDQQEGSASFVDVQKKDGKVTVNWTAQAGKQFTILIRADVKHSILLRLTDATYARGLSFTPLARPGSKDALTGQGARSIVYGAYHVASQSRQGDNLALDGQLKGDSAIEVMAPGPIKKVTFNGLDPTSALTVTPYGSVRATFTGPSAAARAFRPPALGPWKVRDALPERASAYQPDANWRTADLTSTPNAYFSQARTKHVLFASSYGFHSNGFVLFHGVFNLSESQRARSLRIETMGGLHFASATYINGKLVVVSTSNGTANASDTTQIPQGSLVGARNTVLVVIDTMGLAEFGGASSVAGYKFPLERSKQPRGILAFDLMDESKTLLNVSITWKVTGNQGGEALLDKVRGPLNEGGCFAERSGWHLPGYDDSGWTAGDPTKEGVLVPGGMRFFRTRATLDVPKGHDMPMSLVFGGRPYDRTQRWRALVFVNGWQFGKRIANMGPQTKFPIPPGVLNPNGPNDIGLHLWSLDPTNNVAIPPLHLEVQGVFTGAPTFALNNPTFADVRGRAAAM